MSLREIYEGWRNHLVPPERLKKEIERVAEERLKICETCEFNSVFHVTLRPDRHCIICGCTLVAKVKCLSCDCPHSPPKWREVLTEEEEEHYEENVATEDSFGGPVGGAE